MKKIYILLSAIFISSISFSQISNLNHSMAKGKKSNKTTFLSNEKAAPFWSEDFANGIPSSWTNSFAPWVFRGPVTNPSSSTGSQGAYANNGTPIASTTQTNGFIIFDSDYYDNGGNAGAFGTGMYPCPHNGDLKTEYIDLSAYSDVTLRFHSYYRTFAGQAYVDFYVNGALSSRVQVHSNIDVNDATFTDEVALVRVPFSVAGNDSVQMSFVFEGTTNVINNFTGYYFWMIDDVELMETPAFLMDVVDVNHGGWEIGYANTSGFGIDYTFKPMIQSNSNPYLFELKVANAGANPLHGIKMNIEVTDVVGSQVFYSSSDTTTLNILDTAMYLANQSFAPLNMGVYDMSFWASSDSISASDTSYMQGIITDSVYGRDYNNPSGDWRVARDCGGLQLLNIFDVYAADELTSLSAHVADYSVAGTSMFGVIYEVDTTTSPWSFIMLDQTDDYVIQQQDIDNWTTIMFDQPINLPPGPHAIAIGGYAHPLDTFGISVSGDAEVLMSRIQDNGCNLGSQTFGYWYWIRETPMIRMNFGVPAPPPASINESNSSKIQVYPNPNNGKFAIEFNGFENETITYKITNPLGQTIHTGSEKLNNNLIKDFDFSDLRKGVYIISIDNSVNTIIRQINIY